MKRLPTNVRSWLTEPLADDVAESVARIAAADDVVALAIMPDVHLASEVCVGAVLATTELVYPAAVGSDIGCGMATVQINATAELLQDERHAALVLTDLYRDVPSNRHRTPQVLPIELQQGSLSDPRLEKLKQRDGRVQLGTLGRGNHFLELQADSDDRLWVMIHSGSRAIGQAIAGFHAGAPRTGLNGLPASSPAGAAYLADVAWAIEYARQNRLMMLRAVEQLLLRRFDVSVDWLTYVDAHHNHVQWETHDGQRLLVHRKGAQSARLDEAGLIPGSMGTASFHVVGRGAEEALSSCSHGAGRRLSRTEARQRVTSRDVDRQLRDVWYDQRRIDALRDEAPAAYKDIHAVMRAQRALVRIVREVRPVLSYKGV